jgi:hypothetical protein
VKPWIIQIVSPLFDIQPTFRSSEQELLIPLSAGEIGGFVISVSCDSPVGALTMSLFAI